MIKNTIDRQHIISKFKRNGHMLTRPCLDMLCDFVNTVNHPQKKLDFLVEKMNQMVIMNSQTVNQQNLQLAIELLEHRTEKGKNFTTYHELLSFLQKWTIYTLSPYETHQDLFLIEKPRPELFYFEAEDYVRGNQARFNEIKKYNQEQLRKQNRTDIFLGMAFVKCDVYSQRTKIMLQNEINELELVITGETEINCFLLPGCVYLVEGEIKSKNFQIQAKIVTLPKALPTPSSPLLVQKLQKICDNILKIKKHVNEITAASLSVYNVLYNEKEDKFRPALIFGTFVINKLEVDRAKRIVSMYPRGVECVILMLAPAQSVEMDLNKELDGVPVYLIPHINSEGPRMLPKPPLLRHNYNVTVLTNPCRMGIGQHSCMLLNYPLVHSLQTQNLHPMPLSPQPSNLLNVVSSLIYSQNNVGVGQKVYWKQREYMKISRDDWMFICDSGCGVATHEGATSVGNFSRDGDFISVMPNSKTSPIEICDAN